MKGLAFLIAFGFLALFLAGCTYKTDFTASPGNQNGTPLSSDQANALLNGVMQAAGGSQTSDLSQTFTNDRYGLSMRYPSDWKLHTDIEGVLAAFTAPRDSDSNFTANVIVEADDISANSMNATELNQQILVQSASAYAGDIEVVNYTDAGLAGNDGTSLIFTGESDGRQFEVMQRWAQVNGMLYIVTYTAEAGKFQKYLPQAQAIADSLTLSRTAQAGTANENAATATADENQFIGNWRVLSSSIYYDAGGHNAFGAAGSSMRQLALNADHTWNFGSSSGTWSISGITDADWQQWATRPYGPTRKITIENWDGQTVSGPIEESGRQVDFLWLIYHVKPPEVGNAGQIQYKFGHVLTD